MSLKNEQFPSSTRTRARASVNDADFQPKVDANDSFETLKSELWNLKWSTKRAILSISHHQLLRKQQRRRPRRRHRRRCRFQRFRCCCCCSRTPTWSWPRVWWRPSRTRRVRRWPTGSSSTRAAAVSGSCRAREGKRSAAAGRCCRLRSRPGSEVYEGKYEKFVTKLCFYQWPFVGFLSSIFIICSYYCCHFTNL